MNLHMIDLNLLVAFDALITERSVSRAAKNWVLPSRQSATPSSGCAICSKTKF